MQVPKRRHSKSRVRQSRFEQMKKIPTIVIKTKDGKAYKRPHIDEYIEF